MFGMLDFGPFGVLFFIAFALILAVFVWVFVLVLMRRHKNNRFPRLTVEAWAVSRRADTDVTNHPVAGDVTGAHGYTSSSFTTYYVTFEVESGDRMEFIVPPSEYGYIAEGDHGRLTFQGTRFLSFARY